MAPRRSPRKHNHAPPPVERVITNKKRIAKKKKMRVAKSFRLGFPKRVPDSLPLMMNDVELVLPKPIPSEVNQIQPNVIMKLPLSTKVRNQGRFDSCWAIQTANLLEENAKRNNSVSAAVGENYALSPQALINCLPAIYNRDHLKEWVKGGQENDCYMCSTDDSLHLVTYRGMALERYVNYIGKYDKFMPYKSFGYITRHFEIDLAWDDSTVAEIISVYGFLIGTFLCGESDQIGELQETYKFGNIHSSGKSEKELQQLYADHLAWSKEAEAQQAALRTKAGQAALRTKAGKAKVSEIEEQKHTVLIIGVGCAIDGRSFFVVRNSVGPNWGKEGIGYIDRRLGKRGYWLYR